MGGIFGVASKSSCTLDYFSELTITLILEHAEVVWQCMVKTALRVQFTTSRTHRFVPNLMEI